MSGKSFLMNFFCQKIPDFWIPEFDETKSIFIHIPRAAGTSLSHAIYNRDPWHHLISIYRDYNPKKFSIYFKFAFIRNPFDRLLSTYLYSFIQKQRLPSTSVAFVTEFKTFEDFVINWINDHNISSHYFFYPQTQYISDSDGRFIIDFLGRFETLIDDYQFVKNRLLITVDLPQMNTTRHTNYRDHYSKKMQQIVEDVYENDLKLLGYKFNS